MTKAKTKPSLSEPVQSFIQAFSTLLAPWGLPPSAGRVFGYLLLQQTPVALDQIAADLKLSKAGAWSVARELEAFGHIRRYSTPGSKRALYAPSDNFAAPMVKQASLLGEMGRLLQNGASGIASDAASSELMDRAKFYFLLQKAMESAVTEWNDYRAGKTQ